MKKILIAGILIIFCLNLLALPSMTLSIINPPKEVVTFDDYGKYKKLLRQKEVPDSYMGFMTYDQISDLGAFESFAYTYYPPYEDDYWYYIYEYRLKTKNGTILTYKSSPPVYTESPMVFGFAKIAGIEDNIKWLDTYEVFHDFPIPEFFVLEGRFADYRYSGITGNLLAIRTDEFVIEGDFEKIEEEDTLVAQLLNWTTTDSAVLKLITEYYYEDTEEHDRSLIICLSVIGGAAVAAVAAWLITYFVMRKKVKNAYRPATCAGIDVPTEDAPPPTGAPDSTPTPPEETPPNTPTE